MASPRWYPPPASGCPCRNVVDCVAYRPRNRPRSSAEGQGFEPWVRGYPTMVFKTISLGRSDSPPARVRPDRIRYIFGTSIPVQTGPIRPILARSHALRTWIPAFRPLICAHMCAHFEGLGRANPSRKPRVLDSASRSSRLFRCVHRSTGRFKGATLEMPFVR